jgi:pyruvate/2-oxoglutarate dehydrogenase complex dihydrolipoamide dehydrogenase (E3) component
MAVVTEEKMFTGEQSADGWQQQIEHMTIAGDPHDEVLVANVHPPRWINPTPTGKYNLVVIGAGTAGLVSAGGAGGLGAKVALIERTLMGGDCLNVGCVPSKGVIRAARAVYDTRTGGEFGVHLQAEPEAVFAEAMERMRRLRADIAPHDSAKRFTEEFKVDVYLGNGKFTGPATIEVNGVELKFDRAVIATGARAADPNVPGLKETGYYTNENIFTLTALPRRLLVIGAGPIGCELAQAFRRFGSEVTVITDGAQIMPKEDADAAAIVHQQMLREGVRFIFGARVLRAEKRGADKSLIITGLNGEETISGDGILIAVGRTPNVEGLGLEAAGVKYSTDGVEVSDLLQTSNPRIYAAGDVCSKYKFTHAADAMARNVLANAFFFGRRRVSGLVLPWCTFTDPEVAHVGYYEAEAREAGYDVATITQSFADNDRAILDGETAGFARAHYERKTGRILGGTIVARHAGEMIGQLTLAITTGQKLSALSSTIQPYPVQADALKRIGDAYMRTKLTPTVKNLFSKWFAWRRR